MKHKKFLSAFLVSAMTLGMAAYAFAYPTVFPTGVTIYNPEKAYNCYVLVSNATMDPRLNTIYLMDMNGNVVKDWTDLVKAAGTPISQRLQLQPNGNLLMLTAMGAGRAMGFASGFLDELDFLAEFDWDGNLVWKWAAASADRAAHHYITRMENGNTLFLVYEPLSPEVTSALGIRNFPGNEWYPEIRREGITMQGDRIIEVNPAGEVVWEWAAHEDPWFDINRFSPVDVISDWTHGNTCSILPENKWYDAGDVRFKPGNILFNPRNFDEFVLIDRETRRVIWSYASSYQGGFAHPHEPEMIQKGYPGEGNIMVYDNGLFAKHRDHDGRSFVFEIDPVEKEIVWMYGASNFHSLASSSMTRLPNGNTLISEDNHGRIFQVTPAGEIVWEYVAPSHVHSGNICRARPVPYDFAPQLASLPRSEVAVGLPDYVGRPVPRALLTSSPTAALTGAPRD